MAKECLMEELCQLALCVCVKWVGITAVHCGKEEKKPTGIATKTMDIKCVLRKEKRVFSLSEPGKGHTFKLSQLIFFYNHYYTILMICLHFLPHPSIEISLSQENYFQQTSKRKGGFQLDLYSSISIVLNDYPPILITFVAPYK